MSRKMPLIVVSLAIATLAGCASAMLSNERIASNTAGILGLSPNEITIENRRTEMTNTYYTVKTKDGKDFSCVINGGNALTMGMVNPPMCAKKGEPLNTNPFNR